MSTPETILKKRKTVTDAGKWHTTPSMHPKEYPLLG